MGTRAIVQNHGIEDACSEIDQSDVMENQSLIYYYM
jgi:hypothetical protein